MTKLAGILNLTPDSFSDGGAYPTGVSMRDSVFAMAAAGAAVIDVGAESTRPGATPLTAEAEWQRLRTFADEVLPECLRRNITISIDTRHAETAAKMLSRGAHWINDVTGFADPAMVDAVRASECKLVLMHSLSIPADPAVVLPEGDVIAQLLEFAQARIVALAQEGIAKERIIFDPGLGFGKTAAQSWEIVRRVGELKALGVPLLIGHSRKSFLKTIADVPADQRDAATLAVSSYLAVQGAAYLRVHAVQPHAILLSTLKEMQ